MPSATVMTITPEMAAEWLKNNRLNRPLSPGRVEWYVAQIKSSGWLLNGQTIVIGADGSTLDGQHRLEACVKAQMPFTSFVVQGINPEAFHTLDTGRTRQAGDVIGIHYRMKGISEGIDGKRLASACGWLYRYERGQIQARRSRHNRLSNSQIIAVMDNNPGLADCVQHINARKRLRKLAPPGLMAFCYYIFTRIAEPVAKDFFHALEQGTELSEDDPRYLLRERLTRNREMRRSKLSEEYIAALIFKAWIATRAGRPLKVLVWKDAEEFPAIE